MTAHIRFAGPEDRAIIRSIAERTWTFSYRDMISAAQIQYMLERMYSDKSLMEQMDSGHTFFLGSTENTPSGFASCSFKPGTADTYQLHKLYVLPHLQGKGLGLALLHAVLEKGRHTGAIQLELNVNRNNKSIGFYEKQGFCITETTDIDIGGGFFMNDYIMKVSL